MFIIVRKGQLKDLTLIKNWSSSAEITIQAIGNVGDCVDILGKRNPYGRLGAIENWTMTDLLIYSKNPLECFAIVEDNEKNLKLVIKDG